MAHRYLFLKHGLVSANAPGHNGVGRFVPQLLRVTIKFCKESPVSYGVRQFIERDIVKFAENNPHAAVYLKPRKGRQPVVVAEYLNGERTWRNLASCGHQDVRGWMDLVANASGREYMRQDKHVHSLNPTIQGMWNSYVNTDPKVATVTFPSEELTRSPFEEKTASDKLKELYSQQLLDGVKGDPSIATKNDLDQLARETQGDQVH